MIPAEAVEAAARSEIAIQWGVRDVHSLEIVRHPSEESARTATEKHPEWYELVSRPVSRWEVTK